MSHVSCCRSSTQLLVSLLIGSAALASVPALAQSSHDELPDPSQRSSTACGSSRAVGIPKCYASASRLEDFMFGTPLTEDARFAKTDVQRHLLENLWRTASADAAAQQAQKIDLPTLVRLTERIVAFQKADSGDIRVQWPGDEDLVVLERRDFEHYSSIAYSVSSDSRRPAGPSPRIAAGAAAVRAGSRASPILARRRQPRRPRQGGFPCPPIAAAGDHA